jgi:nucleotide-binding universal stress UspA family protein
MKVLACIDSSRYAVSVCDHAAWIATRLDAPVELLHVLERHATGSTIAADRSGHLGVDTRAALFRQLVELDEQRNRLAHEAGWHLLEEAASHVREHGVAQVLQRLAHGELVDHIHSHEADARLVVIGRRGEAEDQAAQHLGRNLERIIRASQRPIVIAAREFRPVRRFLIAYDGGASAEKAIDALVRNPILTDAEGQVLRVGEGTSTERQQLEMATSRLRDVGYNVTGTIERGDPDHLIPATVGSDGSDLLVMGAYGHSRIRTLMVGSTTTAVLRTSQVSVVVVR